VHRNQYDMLVDPESQSEARAQPASASSAKKRGRPAAAAKQSAAAAAPADTNSWGAAPTLEEQAEMQATAARHAADNSPPIATSSLAALTSPNKKLRGAASSPPVRAASATRGASPAARL